MALIACTAACAPDRDAAMAYDSTIAMLASVVVVFPDAPEDVRPEALIELSSPPDGVHLSDTFLMSVLASPFLIPASVRSPTPSPAIPSTVSKPSSTRRLA